METIKVTTRVPLDVWEQIGEEAEARQVSKQEIVIAKLREPAQTSELTVNEKLDLLLDKLSELEAEVKQLRAVDNASSLPAGMITKEQLIERYSERFTRANGKVDVSFYKKVANQAIFQKPWLAPDGKRWVIDGWHEVSQ